MRCYVAAIPESVTGSSNKDLVCLINESNLTGYVMESFDPLTPPLRYRRYIYRLWEG